MIKVNGKKERSRHTIRVSIPISVAIMDEKVMHACGIITDTQYSFVIFLTFYS